ncbi:hypothetical protein WUBG_16557, partial [Wuchereria bancrofti]
MSLEHNNETSIEQKRKYQSEIQQFCVSRCFKKMLTECPQSSHLTFHGTSFTEKFLSKAMRDFSSTVPVPPPRSVHHETDETTVLQEATLNESEQTHLPPASKKTKFEVYVEEAQPAKQTAPFAVYSDENVIPSSAALEKRLSMERDLDYQKNVDIHDDDIYESQSAFRK